MLMKFIRLLIVSMVFGISLFAQTVLFAEGEHASGGQVSGSLSFRIDQYEFAVNIMPPYFSVGKIPEMSITLMQSNRKTPALDAELFVQVKENKNQSAAGIDSKNEMESMGENDMDHGSGGLDFDSMEEETADINFDEFIKLEPSKMAGLFKAKIPSLLKDGHYSITLVVKSIDNKLFVQPIVFGTHISYMPESKSGIYRMIAVFIALMVLTSGFLFVVVNRQKLGLKPGDSLNFLDIPWINSFFKSKWFQPIFQIPTAIIFLIIVFIGISDIQVGDKNIATMLTWTIWWAGVIFTFVLLGRVWCMMCPFGAAQDIIARRMSLKKTFPQGLQNIWLSSFLFLALTWWDSYSGIVNKPALTAYLFTGFFIVSVATAFVYKGRTFCKYICPIGGLIGLYSMFSPLELRSKHLDICRKDTIKGCIRGTSDSHACPMFETPMTLDRNNYCNLCSECIKSCHQENIVIRFRSFAKDLWVTSKGYLDEGYLAMVLIGLTILVTAEMVEPWHLWQDAIIKFFDLKRMGIISHSAQETFAFSFLMACAIFIPAFILIMSSMAVKKLTGKSSPDTSVKKIFICFSYMFIPIGISMHLAHNISHLLTEGQKVIPATQRALNKYLNMGLGEPNWSLAPFMGNEAVFWFQMFILILLNYFSLYAGYRIAVKHFPNTVIKAFIPMMLIAFGFMLMNAYILGQPMALRHTH